MKPRQFDVQYKLAHASLIAAVERLSASIAHEVAQPISAALINAQTALHRLGAQPPDLEGARQALGRIVRDAHRASEIITGIRALLKKELPRRESLEINEAVLDAMALTQGEMLESGVSVRTHLAEDLPLIHGDRIQLQQVVRNLIINAVEAMSDNREGPRELLINTGRTGSDGVFVRVRDSGPGLAPANAERVFETFYTTKQSGLGMGLPICRSIVEAHGGRLWAMANAPHGATFQFTLPSRPGAVESLSSPSAIRLCVERSMPHVEQAAQSGHSHARRSV